MDYILKDSMYIDTLIQDISKKTSLSQYELDIIKDTLTTIYQPMPNTLTSAQLRVSHIDSLRARLSNLIYQVNNIYIAANTQYESHYNSEFTKLTKLGRPNQQAVVSEILKDSNTLNMRDTISYLDNAKQLLYGYLKCLDQSRFSCIERWNDSRRER